MYIMELIQTVIFYRSSTFTLYLTLKPILYYTRYDDGHFPSNTANVYLIKWCPTHNLSGIRIIYMLVKADYIYTFVYTGLTNYTV